MTRSGMVPPTYESNHAQNEFSSRLLLHHFLSEDDIVWLSQFNKYGINEDQKKALIFVREVGAIDNPTYRQISGADILKASTELRALKKDDLLDAKGKGRATYYVPGSVIIGAPPVNGAYDSDNETLNNDSAPPKKHSAPPKKHSAPPLTCNAIPVEIRERINNLGNRADKDLVKQIIIDLCKWKELRLVDVSSIMGKSDKYVLREFISPLRKAGKIQYTIPNMVNHPEQAYKA